MMCGWNRDMPCERGKRSIVPARAFRWMLLAGVLTTGFGSLGCGWLVNSPPPCFALNVRVSDAATGLGIDFARVTARSGVYESDVFIWGKMDYAPDPLTQQRGPMRYAALLPARTYVVEVRADGYEPQVVRGVRVPDWEFGTRECAEVAVRLVPLSAGNGS
jgi:hypothetical protein